MPFDNTTPVSLLDDSGKIKYDLRTGRGRLLYLADQIEKAQPKNFNMGDWNKCALGEARRIRLFNELGLNPRPEQGSYGGREFFGLTSQRADREGWFGHLFGSDTRTPTKEAKVIREFVRAHPVALREKIR